MATIAAAPTGNGMRPVHAAAAAAAAAPAAASACRQLATGPAPKNEAAPALSFDEFQRRQAAKAAAGG